MIAWRRWNASGPFWSEAEPLELELPAASSAPPSDVDWPSIKVDGAKSEQLSAVSKLTFSRLTRRFYRAKIGCVARQVQVEPTTKTRQNLAASFSQSADFDTDSAGLRADTNTDTDSDTQTSQPKSLAASKMIDEFSRDNNEQRRGQSKAASSWRPNGKLVELAAWLELDMRRKYCGRDSNEQRPASFYLTVAVQMAICSAGGHLLWRLGALIRVIDPPGNSALIAQSSAKLCRPFRVSSCHINDLN